MKIDLKVPLETMRCLKAGESIKDLECHIQEAWKASSTSDYKMAFYRIWTTAQRLRAQVPPARDLSNKIATRSRELNKLVEHLDEKALEKSGSFFDEIAGIMNGYVREIESRAISSCGGIPFPTNKLSQIPKIPKDLLKEAAKTKKEREAKQAKQHREWIRESYRIRATRRK